MALPFFNGATKTRDQMLALDLGGRTTKAVHLQRKPEGLVLTNYVVQDAPIFEKSPSPELLGDHFKAVCEALNAKCKLVTLAIGVNDAVARHVEMPPMAVSDMRQVLKNNSKTYLQQDLPQHVFDCFIIPPRASQLAQAKPQTLGGGAKQRALVAGARRQLVEDMESAVRSTGLVADHIVPGLIGPVNAFELAMPAVFAKEVLALVDIGFKNTTICILQEGELVLSRVMGIGGDKFTAGLAEALGISYAEAEGIKIGMPAEVLPNLESMVVPLGRELRASIDFFEHQQDKAVGHVFIGGGSAASEPIRQILRNELMVECKTWNPLASVQVAVPPEQAAQLDQVAPQLAVALGAALAAF